jgi:hypothetical protein
MNQLKAILLFTIIGGTCIFACNQTPKVSENQQHSTDSTDASCSQETIMDPNNAKPMALMMRQMAANADSMKAAIVRNEQLDSTKYPFIRFYLVEPTDPSVLEPTFYENARLFQEAYQALFKHPKEQAKHFNLVIQKCVNCHESYCSGPLKRIRKLYIPLTNKN